jgi:hypothetical protein
MRDWNNTIEFYKSLESNKRYADSSRGMLDLLLELQKHLDFANLQIRTAHMAVYFVIPDTKQNVHVICEELGSYSIFLDHCEGTFYGEEVTVSSEKVISTLKDYLHRIQDKR